MEIGLFIIVGIAIGYWAKGHELKQQRKNAGTGILMEEQIDMDEMYTEGSIVDKKQYDFEMMHFDKLDEPTEEQAQLITCIGVAYQLEMTREHVKEIIFDIGMRICVQAEGSLQNEMGFFVTLDDDEERVKVMEQVYFNWKAGGEA